MTSYESSHTRIHLYPSFHFLINQSINQSNSVLVKCKSVINNQQSCCARQPPNCAGQPSPKHKHNSVPSPRLKNGLYKRIKSHLPLRPQNQHPHQRRPNHLRKRRHLHLHQDHLHLHWKEEEDRSFLLSSV
jgi:hypothetical protein